MYNNSKYQIETIIIINANYINCATRRLYSLTVWPVLAANNMHIYKFGSFFFHVYVSMLVNIKIYWMALLHHRVPFYGHYLNHYIPLCTQIGMVLWISNVCFGLTLYNSIYLVGMLSTQCFVCWKCLKWSRWLEIRHTKYNVILGIQHWCEFIVSQAQ